jgi:predicted metal-dependent phosphoesterase TrpH
MRKVRADLHLHTCLSPCADDKMQATIIVQQARKMGLDMIAICDHNSAENVEALVKAGVREGITVIGGMEITSSEEVHILGLFDSQTELMLLQDTVYENLPGENSDEAFGPQYVIDEWDRVIGKNSKLLIGATLLTIEQIVNEIHARGGLAIAPHVDRQRFSLIGQLGFIPKGLELDALEVSMPEASAKGYHYPVIYSSDAHFPEDIGRNPSCFMLEEASLQEIGKALRQEMGRRVVSN